MKISQDFVLQRWGNGVKTVNPKNIVYFSEKIQKNSIDNLLKLPFCFYFLNTDSQYICLNPEALKACRFDSMKVAFGKTIYDITNKETADRVINVHQTAMKTEKTQFIEKSILRKDSSSFQCISTLFPWYDEDNEVVGVLGCGVIPAEHSFPVALNAIFNMGFSCQLPEQYHNNVYLSKREYQCVGLLKKGFSAKMIGKALSLSPRTVEHYIDNIKNKLGVSSKYDIVQKFLEKGD